MIQRRSVINQHSPQRRALVGCIMAFALLLGPWIAAAQAPAIDEAAVARATTWMVDQQGKDGGFLGFSGESDPGATTDGVIALTAAANLGIEVNVEQALEYLTTNALVYTQTGPGQAAKLALAAVAAGADPTNLGNVNPLSIVQVTADRGLIGFGIYDHALGVLALAAAGEEIPGPALDQFRATRIDDGSWAFDGTTTAGAGDSNTTAVVIQALVAAGLGDDEMVERGLTFLKGLQTEQGGFPYQAGGPADANSTALVVQAILAAGQDPASDEWRNASGALLGFQNESGAFRYTDEQRDDNLFATMQAIPALAGQPLPISPQPREDPASGGSDGTDVSTAVPTT